MKTVKRFAPLLLPSLLLACGQQLVEYADGGGSDATSFDDTGSDAMEADAIGPDTNGSDSMGPEGAGPDGPAPEGAGPDGPSSDAESPDAIEAGADSSIPDSGGQDSGTSDAGTSDSGNRDADAAGFDAAETSAPTVVATDPTNAATGVSVLKIVTATFNEAMDPTTINGATFTLLQGATPVSGLVTYVPAQKAATFQPASVLAVNTGYTATITTGAKSAGNMPLASKYTWTFTTSMCGQAPACSARPLVRRARRLDGHQQWPDLGNRGRGRSPGTAVTGFPQGTVTGGAIHAGDVPAAAAEAAMTTAYNDAAGRTLCAVTVAGDLGGLTLAPGSTSPPRRSQSRPVPSRSTRQAIRTPCSSSRWPRR